MLQSINKKKIYFFLVSFLFISTIFNNNLISNLKNIFEIREVEVENVKKEISENILSNTSFLKDENIFFVNKNFLIERLDKLNFIENINIKKKYPSTINIITQETSLIGITYIDQKKHFVGLNGKFIFEKDIINKKKLPVIFGKFNPDEFILLQKELLKQKVNLSHINRYYFHKNKRWDLYFKNNIIVQLPNKNYSKAIELFREFKISNKIASDTIIDLRVENRLILKNE